MKYTFSIEGTSATGSEPPGREKIVLESRAGESARHIALKILAYLIYRDEAPTALRIEQGVGQRHKPDLVSTDAETEAVRFWIDCGQIETKRLGRIAASNPGAVIVVVKTTAKEARLYARAALRFLPPSPERLARIRFIGFDEYFLENVLLHLRGANGIRVDLSQTESLTIHINDHTVHTRLTRFTAVDA